MVRFPGIPAEAGRRRRSLPAGDHRRGCARQVLGSRNPPDRHRQVALLPASGAHAKYHRTGALTVVISPLVALMADQVAGLKRQGISSCVTVNGLLSLPERHDALDRVRLGDASMLLISPEQLRNPSVRSILEQREVGYWVIDEAHCVSKWGHDFRPDYRYIARFIREYSGDSEPAPLICLTATAKPGVIDDICEHFEERLGVDLKRIDGGAHRDNLSFEVVETDKTGKLG